MGYIVGLGAANVDVHGRSRAAIVMRDSNPGHLHTSVGGVTRNVLENLARQGLDVRLLTAIGGDVYGEMITRHSAAAGIDVSGVLRIEGAVSSCYIAVLDERGDMLLGMSDMSILANITPEYIAANRELIRGAAALVCDPCLPIPTLELVLDAARGTPVFLDPVSTAYARAVSPLAGRFFCIKPNRMELAVLAGIETDTDEGLIKAADALINRGTRRVVVSLGDRGCYWADCEGRRIFRALRPLSDMVNATGAGDAFMSGLIHGYVSGMDVEATMDYALACGIVAIHSDQTISPFMSDGAVSAALREYRL